MHKYRITLICFGLLIVLSLLLTACPARRPPSPTEGDLSLSGAPILGKTVQITYFFWLSSKVEWNPTDDITVAARIELPSNFELVGGRLEWQGSLRKGSKGDINATIRAVKKGTSEIRGNVSVPQTSRSFSGSSSDTVYSLVLSDRAFFGHQANDLPGALVHYAVNNTRTDELVISPELSLPRAPKLGQTGELTLTATAMVDAPNAQVSIQLPREIELVSGNLQWSGNMARGDVVVLKATIRPAKAGKWLIQSALAFSRDPGVLRFLPGHYLYLYVFEDGSDTVEGPPITETPKVQIDFFFSSLPGLNQQAEVVSRVTALNGDLPNAEVGIHSTDLNFISENRTWRGNLYKGVPVELRVPVQPAVNGTLPIMSTVSAFDAERDGWVSVGMKYLYLQVNDASAILVPQPTFIQLGPTLNPR